MRPSRCRVVALLLLATLAACGSDAVELTRPKPPVTTSTSAVHSTTPMNRTAADVAVAAALRAAAMEAAAADPADDPLLTGAPRPARSGPAPRGRRGPEPTGHIEIPAIGLSHATYEGIDLATINHGPSHWPGTALPGERGNAVYPGHRTTYSRPFWDLDRLRPGDEVIFTTAAGRFTYRVTETLVVGSRDTWIAEPTEHATFTIFACHPKGSARQRYVAKGELVSPPAPPASSPTTSTTAPPPPTTTTTAPEEEQQRGIVPLLPG